MPEVIISDQDVKFAVEFWTIRMKKVKTKLQFNMTFTCKPMAKRVNGILNQYFKNYVATNHRDWGHKLGLT